MSIAPSQWTVKIISPPVGPLSVQRDGVALPAEIGSGLTTPVEVLLVSVGTCFALSCHAAFAGYGLQRVGFELNVTGRKAIQPPSRLEALDMQITFDAALSPEDARRITASAERLCTVTNTLSYGVPCSVIPGGRSPMNFS